MIRRLARLGRALACLLGVSVVPVACTCKSADPTPLERTAEICQRRVQWASRHRPKCTECVAFAKAPHGCKATEREYSARCEPAQRAKLDAKACEEVFRCADKCKPTDCACVGRCYEGQELCDKIAATVDSCVAKVCEPHCR